MLTKLLFVFALASIPALAAPPECSSPKYETDTVYEPCRRSPDLKPCLALLMEGPKIPEDPAWNGCAWGAIIIKSTHNFGGFSITMVSFTFVASFTNSEKMDIKLDLELANHTHRVLTFPDKPIVLRRDDPLTEKVRPQATVMISSKPDEEIVGVPTAEVTEKGGSRTMSHTYN